MARCPFLRSSLALLLWIPGVASVACSSRGARKSEVDTARSAVSDTVRDTFGDLVSPPARVTRIVSLTPATTEILFALGAGDRVVGRDMYSHWPDAALHVADLGPGLRPNVEAVLAAHPDLVLLYASEGNRAAAQRLRQAGITTAAFKVDRIEQFDFLTRFLGRLIGDSARGALVADTVKRT